MNRKTAKMVLWATALGSLLSLVSCSYGHREFVHTNQRFGDDVDNYVVQLDDYGQFWDARAAEQALAAVTDSAGDTNTVVVLMVHGWHHNANGNDQNLMDFTETLTKVRSKLEDNEGGSSGVYRRSRELLTGSGDIRIIGIYVGWRGKSLPGFLDNLTFWGRKAAAERVGEGDLRSFMRRLNQLYSNANTMSSRLGDNPPKKPFMGLISIGHSFGGQALFRAVEATLEHELTEAKVHDGGTYGPITGYGDLVVLVNPALEAFQYRTIHELSRSKQFDYRQPPVFLVLSESTDIPRRILFPMGRGADAVFRAGFRPGQREQWTQALGEYLPQRTHNIDVDLDGTSHLFDPGVYADPCRIINYDLTYVPSIGSVSLKPTGTAHPYNPFIVAYAKPNAGLIFGHSGLYPLRKEVEAKLADFLNDYVAMVEGKRILLRAGWGEKCSTEVNISQGGTEERKFKAD